MILNVKLLCKNLEHALIISPKFNNVLTNPNQQHKTKILKYLSATSKIVLIYTTNLSITLNYNLSIINATGLTKILTI